MRALLLVLLASAGCAFDAPDGDSSADPTEDPTTNPPAEREACNRNDSSLKVCVDFSAPLADRSSRGVRLEATGVIAADRDGEPAAQLDASTTMHVREDTELDVDRVTIDMWIRPAGTPASATRYWLLDNNMQYAMSFTDARKVRCVIGSQYVDSEPLADDGHFHHVACAYDGAQLRVFVDGGVAHCLPLTIPIAKTGTSGLAIGANLSGSDASPTYMQRFLGGLDDVRVWSRADLDVCALAGKTGCNSTCL